ncbi:MULTISPECIES: hypothetical protein [Lacticaseibacillus]|uniref:Lipoprotein n=2 Tax=Lacticaseibacillus TaxID=2759736 RepID=A0AAN1EZH1_LACCA|nr:MULTISPECIES: hypothetical protein [Lacticaseibacillus]ARY91971.1 hypothetical protein BGL52_09485 [Lacticaseibacillus casei]KAB1971018.1 hypothetical protein F9B82_00565 [Lacticaseibacillus casei]WLV79873.1 hypothetical protein LACSTY_001908 [Lacticaseibacillus sp. NCIMB 15473]WNX23833.1 hypothetical protein RWA15_09250 [Lacticaseibacillus casei]WNX26608.1 hypothetical protein RWA16_09255 [Lacticaseibacillus casei]
MKKTLLVLPVLLLVFAAGCGQSNQSSNSQKESVKTSQTSHKTKKASAKKSNGKTSASQSSAQSSSQIAASTTSQTGQKAATAASSGTTSNDQRLATLKRAVFNQIPNAKWPASYPVANSQHLNIFATGDQANYSIFFSPGQSALPYNDPTLQNINAELAIQKKTYASAADAQAQVAPARSTQELRQVAIGDGIYAASQGAAGSSYLTWNEGRWTVTVKASAVNGEDPLPLAKQAVAWFAKNALPVPDTHGTVDLAVTDANTRQNQITWTEGNALYMISGLEPMHTIQVGTATR